MSVYEFGPNNSFFHGLSKSHTKITNEIKNKNIYELRWLFSDVNESRWHSTGNLNTD